MEVIFVVLVVVDHRSEESDQKVGQPAKAQQEALQACHYHASRKARALLIWQVELSFSQYGIHGLFLIIFYLNCRK